MKQDTINRLIRLPEVIAMTGLSKSSIYNLIKDKESKFPPIIKLGERASAFSLVAVQKWIDDKINQGVAA